MACNAYAAYMGLKSETEAPVVGVPPHDPTQGCAAHPAMAQPPTAGGAMTYGTHQGWAAYYAAAAANPAPAYQPHEYEGYFPQTALPWAANPMAQPPMVSAGLPPGWAAQHPPAHHPPAQPRAPHGPPSSWTAAEDMVLIEHVAQYWPCGWAQCAAKMGTGRSGRAVQCRWSEICNTEAGLAALGRAPVVPVAPPHRPGAWTVEEDNAVLEHVARQGPGQWASSTVMLRTGRSSEAAHTRWHKWLKGTEAGQAALAKSRAAKEAHTKHRNQALNGCAKAIYKRDASGKIRRVDNEPTQNAGDVAVADGRAVAVAPPPYPVEGGGNRGGDDGSDDGSDDGDVVGGNGVDGAPRTLTTEEREELTATPTWLSAEEAARQAAADGLTLERSTNSAGYKGVTVLTRVGQFGAQVSRQLGRTYLGTYESKEAAALAIARYTRALGAEPGAEKEEEEKETLTVGSGATDRLDLRARRALINEADDATHHGRRTGARGSAR